MLTLILAVGLAVAISFVCSLSEAAFYSVSPGTIERLRSRGLKSGEMLHSLREDIEKPITAILTLNTVANTAGSAVAGAAAVVVFSDEYLGLFTAGFTVLILIMGEVIPKTLGVVYAEKAAPLVAGPVRLLMKGLFPVIWLSSRMLQVFRRGRKGPQATEDDIRAVVSLTRKAGLVQPYEELAITNVLSMDMKTVDEIMTPRIVVFSLPATMTVSEAKDHPGFLNHSRIPVHEEEDREDVIGIVFRRQILEALANDRHEATLGSLMRPVEFVLESLSLDRLLSRFLEARTHLFVVLDEYGGMAGVVSLEDVMEEILGKEIVDETDQVADMRDLARRKRRQLVARGDKAASKP